MATEAYKLTIGGLQFGAWMQNEMYYLFDNGAATDPWTVAKNLCNDWYSHNAVSWLGCMPASYGMQWLSAIRVSAGGGKTWLREFPGGTVLGTLGTHPSSLSTAPIIKLFPAMGVNTQGRLFLPAPGEGYLVDNVYQSAYISAVNTLIGNIVSFTVSGRTWALGIHSPKLANTYSVSAAALGSIIGNIGRRRTPR